MKEKIAVLQDKFWALGWKSEIISAPIRYEKTVLHAKQTKKAIKRARSSISLAFDREENYICYQLAYNYHKTTKTIMFELMESHQHFKKKHLRTLQRIISELKSSGAVERFKLKNSANINVDYKTNSDSVNKCDSIDAR